MYRHEPSAVCWTTLIILIVSLVLGPAVARAQNHPRYSASGGSSGPIGMIWSDGQVRMNGRLAGGGQPVWSGDLLEAVSSASNQVFIESVGQVSLMSNARVRLSLGATGGDEQSIHPVLVAALLDGDLALRLNQEASAYVETGGQGFQSSAGAVFRIGMRDGHPFVDTERGWVEPASTDSGRIISVGSASMIDRKTNSTRAARGRTNVPKGQEQTCLVELRWVDKPGRQHLVRAVSWAGGLSLSRMQGDSQPAVGVPVAFRLTNLIGTLNGQTDVIVKTDAAGIARVTFTALKNGSATLIGKVMAAPDDTCVPSDEVRWEIRVPRWLTPTKLIIFGAVATIATYPLWRPERKIKQVPPVEIIP
ncbi:MAG: hypothetical protein ACJ74J_16575 [Blastocatellia bacterium]